MIAIIDNNNMFLFYKEVMQQAKQQNIDMVFVSFSQKKHQLLIQQGLKSIYLKDFLDGSSPRIGFSDIEKEFPEFTVNQCIENDRLLKDFPKEKAEKFLIDYFNAFGNFLENNDVSLIIGEITWGVEYLFYHLAKYKKILYANPLNIFALSKIRLVFFDKYNSTSFFIKTETSPVKTGSLIDSRKKMDVNQTLGKKLRNFSIHKYFGKLLYYHLYRDSFDYRYSIIMKIRRVRIMLRQNLLKLFERFIYSDSCEDDYFYYPLHVQPEATPDIVAVNYNNQMELISQLSRSLPYGTKLVVKEHPNAFGNEPLSKLLRIKKKKNVVLVHPQTKSKELIKNSLGVITIAGTVGIEARLENKPVLIFSNIYYATLLDGIFKITNFDDLSALLKSFQSKRGKYPCLKCKEFFEYMYTHSFDCYIYDPLVDPNVLDPNNIHSFLSSLKEFQKKMEEKALEGE